MHEEVIETHQNWLDPIQRGGLRTKMSPHIPASVPDIYIPVFSSLLVFLREN